MKRILTLVAAVALLAWTGLGMVAWMAVAGRLSLAAPSAGDRGPEPELLALTDDVAVLRDDLRALANGMEQGIQVLRQDLAANLSESAALLERRVAALRDELGSRDSAPAPEDPAPDPERAAPAPVPAAAAAVEAAPRRSFLAFRLPSDDVRFDERRAWTILPALSRVGFDAQTTLHDFTGQTSDVEGTLEADLSRPAEAPRGSIRVRAAALVTGDLGRDEAMREHLAVDDHPTLEFELARFEPLEIDVAGLRASGTAHGRMRIRGVVREVAMPVELSIDDSRRLTVDGETTIDLADFSVPVPKKLGLISMDEEVRLWVSLRLRAAPRSEG
jgi:polyisoprenoid-binding protein YceI